MRRLALTASVLVLIWPAALLSAGTRDVAGDALAHVDAAHAAGYSGRGVTVAILDTGIDGRNPSLAGRVVDEHCFVPPDGCPNGAGEQDGMGSAQDDHGHGTEIAGIVADTAPDAVLVVAKVTDANGRTSAAQVAAALEWVRTRHPEAKVVNMSLAGDIPLSGDCSRLTPSLAAYAATIESLDAGGTAVIAAAGNGGRTNGLPAPACFASTIAVGAVYTRSVGAFTAPEVCVDRTTAAGQLACFSNTSSELDLLAAGVPVETIGLGGGTATITGTSASSAQVAGVAALLLQADASLTPDNLLSVLRDSGAPVRDTRSHVVQPIVPRVDAAAALGQLLGRPIPLLPSPPAPEPGPAPPPAAPDVPALGLAVRQISFGSVRPERLVRRRVVVRNTGSGVLTVRASSSSRWVRATPSRLRVSTAPRLLTLVFRPARPGRYSGEVRLATDDPSRPLVRIRFDGRATVADS